jgi:hypothetical protein
MALGQQLGNFHALLRGGKQLPSAFFPMAPLMLGMIGLDSWTSGYLPSWEDLLHGPIWVAIDFVNCLYIFWIFFFLWIA